MNNLEEIVIDKEYPGHENNIKWIILNMVKRDFPNFKEEIPISFKRIGKNSSAHKIAWKTYKKAEEADKKLKCEEILFALFK